MAQKLTVMIIGMVMMGVFNPIGAAKNKNPNPNSATEWRNTCKVGDGLPPLVKAALLHLPLEVQSLADSFQIVAVQGNSGNKCVAGYMTEILGYPQDAVKPTLAELANLAEFTLDSRLPIFIRTSSATYAQLEQAWSKGGNHAQQAAMILASDLWHEYHHGKFQADEVHAHEAQVILLKTWDSEGKLFLVRDYIKTQEIRLAEEKRLAARQVVASR